MFARYVAALFNSLNGFIHAFRTEPSVRDEILVLIPAVPLAFWLTGDGWHRIALIGVVMLVIALELLNTCVEKLCDHVTPNLHPQIKVIKDMGSAAAAIVMVLGGALWLLALWERVTG
ncbi:diacylglycerol kinase [Methylovirgula sp. 4M-Z18]|uniref:diacylglycerol kinase n=1 Tax=Methylovirgula sp. 4M-Z18 TaxID=2293567 RepID=UPI001313FD4D|nr:diacylglycerol kinase [Methylovirgula sp. 4M-Z18]